MTTNFVRSLPGSRIKQLEFASVTPNSTCSLSTAASVDLRLTRDYLVFLRESMAASYGAQLGMTYA